MEKYVLDTSIIIDGKVPRLMSNVELDEVLIPYVVLDELQNQASRGREEGFKGLEELRKIRDLCEKRKIKFRFVGQRPGVDDIKLAAGGRLDALIRDVAKEENAILITADYVQRLVGDAEGVRTKYILKRAKRPLLSFKKFFTEDTMSVHLKLGAPPYAKKGQPGKFTLVKIQEKPLTRGDLRRMTREITDNSRHVDSFIQIDEDKAMVLQLDEYRIAIAKPPFSDGQEITIIRPLIKLRLDDYHLSEKLMERLVEKAEGILIAGPPGSGKTTFISSIAEYYSKQGKIVKTMESVRDMQVSPEVTQYAPLKGSFAKTASFLLLVRPDNVIFDEIKESKDFKVFADLRLAGVGMVGTIHSTNAIDAVQRFISRTELGILPSIIDTIIFIKYGKIEKVYAISLVVRVPTGMIGQDFIRPLVEVRDFESQKLEYEVYTFGNENVVIPVQPAKQALPDEELVNNIFHSIKKYDKNPHIELLDNTTAVVKVKRKVISKLIGRDGRNIAKLEEALGIHLNIVPK